MPGVDDNTRAIRPRSPLTPKTSNTNHGAGQKPPLPDPMNDIKTIVAAIPAMAMNAAIPLADSEGGRSRTHSQTITPEVKPAVTRRSASSVRSGPTHVETLNMTA